MDKFVISGGKPLKGIITVAGAKNVAMKVILAGILTDDSLIIHNVPFISSVLGTTKIVEPLGVSIKHSDHTLTISGANVRKHKVPLELAGIYRTAPMVMGPLLARFGKAIVPNPGGCRIGKRPVDWMVEALRQLGAKVIYRNGFFYAEGNLKGTRIHFRKNTHTGTETVILAAVLAKGKTIIENASEEPEVDDLIRLLMQMGARIKRDGRTIHIEGVSQLHGTEYTIMPDRNEVVTYAVAAIATGGDVIVKGTQREHLKSFFTALDQAGAGWEPVAEDATRFYKTAPLKASAVITKNHPGFMTDWQAPWAILATQAQGISTIHETVFESRFQYVLELRKMGAKIEFYDPTVKNPEKLYNFNWSDRVENYHQAIKIIGPAKLHDAVVEITDLRAGATLVLAALVASGRSVLHGVEHIDRGYEHFDKQLNQLGATIYRVKESL